MFCFKCGGSMPDSSAVCPQCGAAVADAPQPAPPSMPPPGTAYGVPPTQPHGYRPPTDAQATASMIFGILGLTCFWGVAGLPAVILGHISKSNIRKSMGQLGGEGMATAGMIMGYISIAMGVLIGVAVIIPNLHRARVEESESAAKSTVRTLNTSQVIYTTRYQDAGYARDLSTLGPGPSGVCAGEGNATHACLIDAKLGCSGGTWCVKGNYNYNVTGADCTQQGGCTDYLIVAVPAGSAGNKRFCSTSDAVLRSQAGGTMQQPPTVAECMSWSPL
jgi:hypothetical protein